MSTSSAPAVSQADIDAYRTDGAVCIRRAFGQTWIDMLRAATDKAMAAPGPHAEEYTRPGNPGRYFGDLDVWARWPVFRAFARNSPAGALAGALMQSGRINLLYDQLLVKEPGTRDRTPWHQDQPYWAVQGRQVCSVWLALDEVEKAACVEYVAGSHEWGATYNPHHFLDDTPYDRPGLAELPDIDALRGELRILSWDMEPGDCIVFQAMVVHGAQGNASAVNRRRALSTRWVGDDARFVRPAGEFAIPTTDPGLPDGSRFDEPTFPLVWQRE